jgi:hypothetical protein
MEPVQKHGSKYGMGNKMKECCGDTEVVQFEDGQLRCANCQDRLYDYLEQGEEEREVSTPSLNKRLDRFLEKPATYAALISVVVGGLSITGLSQIHYPTALQVFILAPAIGVMMVSYNQGRSMAVAAFASIIAVILNTTLNIIVGVISMANLPVSLANFAAAIIMFVSVYKVYEDNMPRGVIDR